MAPILMTNPLRHLEPLHDKSSTFGTDRFGQAAESFARYFGTPKFIIIQTTIVLIWIATNAIGFILKWDPYPFILLNLMFSTQAAYAAPLILLAQTRQADRDKAHAEATARHNQEESDLLKGLIEDNTKLTKEIHEKIDKPRTTRPKGS